MPRQRRPGQAVDHLPALVKWVHEHQVLEVLLACPAGWTLDSGLLLLRAIAEAGFLDAEHCAFLRRLGQLAGRWLGRGDGVERAGS